MSQEARLFNDLGKEGRIRGEMPGGQGSSGREAEGLRGRTDGKGGGKGLEKIGGKEVGHT